MTHKHVADALNLYRIEDSLTENGVELFLQRFVEVRTTPTGRWVCMFERAHTLEYFGGWRSFADAKKSKIVRWVSSYSTRSRCYVDFKLALSSYMHRKSRQEIHARTALETSELAVQNKDQIMSLTPDDFQRPYLLGKIDVMYRYHFD